MEPELSERIGGSKRICTGNGSDEGCEKGAAAIWG